MKNLFVILCILFLSISFAQAPDTAWTRTFDKTDWDFGLSVQQTLDGGYIIAGEAHGSVYLLKTDSIGDTIWTKTYAGGKGRSVQQTFDRGYIVAGSNGDVYLLKTDSLGDTLWTRAYGTDSSDGASSVQQTADSGYIVIGDTWSCGEGCTDMYVLKTDPNGDTIWAKTYGGRDWDGGNSVQQISDGGYIVVGYTSSSGAGQSDVYLIRIDSLGNIIWTKTYGGENYDFGESIKQTSDGGYIIAGMTASFGAGYSDVYLLKTDSLGDTLWTRAYGDTLDNRGYATQQTYDGGYIIAGVTGDYGNFDVYLIKTDANGDTVWSKTLGGTDEDWSFSIQQTFDRGYIVTGTTSSFIIYGADVWLIKIEPDTVGIGEHKILNAPIVYFNICPNPFRNVIDISWQITDNSIVDLKIYDISGRLIRQFDPKTIRLSDHISWDGTDNANRKLPSGVYFVEFEADDYKITEKLLFIK